MTPGNRLLPCLVPIGGAIRLRELAPGSSSRFPSLPSRAARAAEDFAMLTLDQIESGVQCTHKNTTQADVHFGDSSLAEMCFAGVYRYPAIGGFFICADDFATFGM